MVDVKMLHAVDVVTAKGIIMKKIKFVVVVTENSTGDTITKLSSTKFMDTLRVAGLARKNDFVQKGIKNYNSAYPKLTAELTLEKD